MKLLSLVITAIPSGFDLVVVVDDDGVTRSVSMPTSAEVLEHFIPESAIRRAVVSSEVVDAERVVAGVRSEVEFWERDPEKVARLRARLVEVEALHAAAVERLAAFDAAAGA